MQLRLPKPLHGWRAFAGEVGIIVIGVLLALGAQQLVEAIHDRAEVRDAEGAMIAELRDDNLPQAYARVAIYNCYANQLDAIEAAVASRDRAKVLKLAQSYRPVARTYDDLAWQAALASQVLVHSGSERILGWSTAYRLVPRLDNRSDAEQDELGDLYASIGGTGPLSADQQDRLFRIVSTLRRINRGMAGSSLVFISYLTGQKLKLSRAQQDTILADARKAYGSCVIEPADRFNSTSQIYMPENILPRKK